MAHGNNMYPHDGRPAAKSSKLILYFLAFVAVLAFVAITSYDSLLDISTPAALDENSKGAESFAARIGREMLGPLAAIPEILEEHQQREITRNLDQSLRNHRNGNDNSTHHPVLFVPGLFGTQLETKLTNRAKAHWWLPSFVCPKSTDSYQRTWMLHETWWNVLPYILDCSVEQLLTRWNISSDNSTPTALPWRTGIDTRTKKTFESVMYLDQDAPVYQYYADWLTKYLGYQPYEQMISQGYDWRMGPETWMLPGREFDQLKGKIEQVVQNNQGKGVVALSISAGGPFLALFLNLQEQEWKDRHVHAWVSVSAALSGSAIAPMQSIGLQHNSFFSDQLPAYFIKALGRIVSSTSSVLWLFPHQDSFHDAVITTPSRSYKAHELGEALEDAKYPEQAKLYRNNRPYFGGSNLVPGVQTFCLSGYGIDTISGLKYNTSDMSDEPVGELDDGDNCVTVEALRQCDAWAQHQEAPIHVSHYFNGSHGGLLYDPRVVSKFFDVVVGKEEAEEEELVALS